MYSQRKKERRGCSGKTSFPLVTNEGHFVENDRRSVPDRRMDNIHLELIDMVNHELPEFITTTPFYSSGKEDY
jgi:hypothetical protein